MFFQLRYPINRERAAASSLPAAALAGCASIGFNAALQTDTIFVPAQPFNIKLVKIGVYVQLGVTATGNLKGENDQCAVVAKVSIELFDGFVAVNYQQHRVTIEQR